jgi:16S rRNA (adenine1518-N6/adenine1519-N6)-dimethyltransferase
MPSPKTLLTARDIRPKKSLGQNFLCDPQAAEAIVRHGRIGPEDTVVEIGAGTGALTVPAARAAAGLYAVETDGRLMEVLTENIRENDLDNVTIVNRSIMDVDLAGFYEKAGRRLVVMGNLPYYISSQILVRLIQARRFIERAVLMFQQELADRITAPPGSRDYGRLSVMLRYCAEVKSLMHVRKELFYPRPQVASVVVGIVFNRALESAACDDEMLFDIIKTAFSKRRKTIRNALSSGNPEIPPATWDQVLEKAGIHPDSRAEALDAPAYVDICRGCKELAALH